MANKTEYEVLDKGFVRLVDVMGDDSSIVQAARVSYGEGTKSVSDDTALIRYLMREQHTSPFEMVEFKFHIKMPIFVARQWIRQRTANVNEYSGRYSIMPDEAYTPSIERIQGQSKDNKQGSDGNTLDDAEDLFLRFADEQRESFEEYASYLQSGVSRELARINLPLSQYTQMYWKIDLHNMFKFLQQRMDKHAQFEIQEYAKALFHIVKDLCPIATKAFLDYRLFGESMSSDEMCLIRLIAKGTNKNEVFEAAENRLSPREMKRFMEKLGLG